MNDRELLELAAKAVGYVPVRMSDDEDGLLLEGIQDVWRPHLDDGDALRLAATMRLDIMYTDRDVEAISGLPPHIKMDAHKVFAPFAIELTGTNTVAATRRAIVRAAAEIGKGMP